MAGDKGGHSGLVNIDKGHDMYMAPTVDQKFNTYRPPYFPVACWHIYDIRFEFDSSFVLPDAQDELADFKRLCGEHPESPVTIFGHADPVGNEDYNKGLSGRRARAVYALVTRDVDAWEELYTKSNSGGDIWGSKCYKKMLEATGMDPNTPNTKAKRAEVFRAYMDFLCGDFQLDKGRFLGKGADPNGKADYQGCGEFNPLLLFSKAEQKEFDKPQNHNKRNQENGPNRRVIAYLFRKDTVVDPGKWPCPAAKDGVAGCKKRFWSDSSARLTLGADRRLFESTHDTFACRFYHRIANASPCESLQAPPTLMKIWNLKWVPEKGACGDKVKFTGETNLVDGTILKWGVKTDKGDVSKFKPFEATVGGGKFEQEVEIKNIGFNDGSSFLDKVLAEAVLQENVAVVESDKAILTVEALLDAAEQTYIKDRNNEWGANQEYVNHAEFKQELVKFRHMVSAGFEFVYARGGYTLKGGGITGSVPGCPRPNERWGRSTVGDMIPEIYHDGTSWQPIPAAWLTSSTFDYNSVAFHKKGSKWVALDYEPWEFPGGFEDVDEDDPLWEASQQKMVQATHDLWTDILQTQREDCKSEPGTRCCRYDVEVNIKFKKAKKWGKHTIAMCPGDQRAHASCWYMGGDPNVAAHETGHHLDNPDEYLNGAIDPAVNVPGEIVNGVQVDGTDTLMGRGTKLRVRHLKAIAEKNADLIKAAYGRTYKYIGVTKV